MTKSYDFGATPKRTGHETLKMMQEYTPMGQQSVAAHTFWFTHWFTIRGSLIFHSSMFLVGKRKPEDSEETCVEGSLLTERTSCCDLLLWFASTQSYFRARRSDTRTRSSISLTRRLHLPSDHFGGWNKTHVLTARICYSQPILFLLTNSLWFHSK